VSDKPRRTDAGREPCDACLFLNARRPCPRCYRPLCLDCMFSHICVDRFQKRIDTPPRPFPLELRKGVPPSPWTAKRERTKEKFFGVREQHILPQNKPRPTPKMILGGHEIGGAIQKPSDAAIIRPSRFPVEKAKEAGK